MLTNKLINIEYVPYSEEREIEQIKESLTGIIILNREEKAVISVKFNQEVG